MEMEFKRTDLSVVPPRARKFVAGGVAGCLAKAVVSPFDRIKIVRQAEHPIYGPLSIKNCAKEIIKREGFFQLWRGLPALVFRIFPYGGTQFLSFDIYKELLAPLPYPNHKLEKNLLAGAGAGCTAVIVTYPADTIRTRILYTTKDDTRYSTKYGASIYKTIKTINAHDGGVRNFYNGMRPALWGMLMYAGVSFGTFETLKEKCKTEPLSEYGISLLDQARDGKGQVLKWWVPLVLGSTAGVISQTICFPLDTARRRMQNAQMIKTQQVHHTTLQTLQELIRRGGFRYVYRGLSLNYIRVIPSAAIGYACNEYFHKLLGVPRKL